MRILLIMTSLAVRQIMKMPIMYLCFFIYPVLLPAIIGYLTHYNFSGGITSYEYYSHGLLLALFMVSGLCGTYNFVEDSQRPGYMRFIYAPVSKVCIYFSQILASSFFGITGMGCSMLIFKYVLHVNYNGCELLIFAAISALIFCSNAFAVFLCTILAHSGIIDMIFNLIMAVFGILGGAFFPFESLGPVQAALAKVSPIKWLLDGILNCIYDNSTRLLLVSVTVLLLVGTAFAVLCRFTFRTEKCI